MSLFIILGLLSVGVKVCYLTPTFVNFLTFAEVML